MTISGNPGNDSKTSVAPKAVFCFNITVTHTMTTPTSSFHLVGGWPTLLKNLSQLGWLFGKIKNVPNHQPVMKHLNHLNPEPYPRTPRSSAPHNLAIQQHSRPREAPVGAGCVNLKVVAKSPNSGVNPYLNIRIWVRAGYPNNWMVSSKSRHIYNVGPPSYKLVYSTIFCTRESTEKHDFEHEGKHSKQRSPKI